ncbi:MAG: nucleotidyltransferase domain-containing protein [Hyphomicrobiales bacterium]|nr:nucleotidyltransferase domain-containing protein [Hyphomicrobiales bacterium]MDE2018588.1 nucleotidyltransferase domain-containing protein [Hyphomicrobiales bacterium]
MDANGIIATLRAAETVLRSKGVAHAGLFGSRVRDEARDDSDIDILLDMAPDADLSLFGYVGVAQFVEDLFQDHVHVSNRAALKAAVRPNVEREARFAF